MIFTLHNGGWIYPQKTNRVHKVHRVNKLLKDNMGCTKNSAGTQSTHKVHRVHIKNTEYIKYTEGTQSKPQLIFLQTTKETVLWIKRDNALREISDTWRYQKRCDATPSKTHFNTNKILTLLHTYKVNNSSGI